MTDESQLLELVARWKAAREAGKPITPEELCSGSSELSAALRSTLVRLYGSEALDTSSPSGSEETCAFELHSKQTSPHVVGHYQVGIQVAGFRLLREIGSGGFGQVFEAEDPLLNRQVAIKFLLPQAYDHAGIQEQFLSEARSMASIQHENVVPIYQVGQIDSKLFLVMPLLAGETLAHKLKREGSLPPAEVRRIGQELCHGLAALHSKGLIHRDIKPANLWLDITTRRVKVLDLGLADDVANLRATNSAGKCATGRRAFRGEKVSEVMEAVRRSEPAALREINPGVPPDLAELIHRLLHKDRTSRPASASEVADMLSTSSATSSRPTMHRGRMIGLLAVLALLTSIGGLSVFLKSPNDPTAGSETEAPTASISAAPLAIESLQVIPWKSDGDRLTQALPPLGSRGHVLPTTTDAIEVSAKLSHPAYAYIILYRSDGQDVLLFPQEDDAVPPLTDHPRYPSSRPDVRYVLDDGPGIWVVALLASTTPLPTYREWRQQHPNQPWKPQLDPSHLSMAMLDNGRDWQMLGTNRSFNRGERKFQLEPYQMQMDWLKQQTKDGTVMGVAFPVR